MQQFLIAFWNIITNVRSLKEWYCVSPSLFLTNFHLTRIISLIRTQYFSNRMDKVKKGSKYDLLICFCEGKELIILYCQLESVIRVIKNIILHRLWTTSLIPAIAWYYKDTIALYLYVVFYKNLLIQCNLDYPNQLGP